MERGIRRILCCVGALCGVTITVMTCSNPIDILQSVKTEAMVANNKFLLIKDGAPAKNATSVNPSDPIWIEFDRVLDQATISPQAITFSPATTWNYDYNSSARTLSIHPISMEALTSYTVTVTGLLKGTDGSSLQNNHVLTFSTANLPGGNIYINCPDPVHPSSAAYAISNNVTLKVTYNAAVADYRYSITKSDITASEGTGIQNWLNKGDQPPAGFPLSGVDGSNSVYVQFRKVNSAGGNNLTDAVNPISASIVVDTTNPTVSAGTMSVLNSAVQTRTTNASASDASGITAWSWTKESGPGTITFGTPSALKTTLSASVDGAYSARLTVTDGVGHTNYSLLTVNRDTVPPNTPVFDAITTPTVSNTPTWTWTSGGGGGNGVYQLLLLKAGERVWKNEVTTTSCPDADSLKELTDMRLYPFSDGLWTLQVAELDAAGNVSAFASSPIRVTPVLPLDRATVNSALPIHFEWRPMTDGYKIFYMVEPGSKPVLLRQTANINFIDIPAGTLKGGTYYWYVDGSTLLPAGAPKTYFTVTVK